MIGLDNYRTHFCPDSGFSLISENDAEFEACKCYMSAAERPAVAYLTRSDASIGQSSSSAAEEVWYRSLVALAEVCGTGTRPEHESVEKLAHEETAVESKAALVTVRRT